MKSNKDVKNAKISVVNDISDEEFDEFMDMDNMNDEISDKDDLSDDEIDMDWVEYDDDSSQDDDPVARDCERIFRNNGLDYKKIKDSMNKDDFGLFVCNILKDNFQLNEGISNIDMDDVKRCRIDNNMSQREFAKKFDIPFTTYVQWENKRRNPPAYVLNLIAKAICFDDDIEIKVYSRITEKQNMDQWLDAGINKVPWSQFPVQLDIDTRILEVINKETGMKEYYLTIAEIPSKNKKRKIEKFFDSIYDPEKCAELMEAHCDYSF